MEHLATLLRVLTINVSRTVGLIFNGGRKRWIGFVVAYV